MQESQETWVQSLYREDPLEEGMATYSSILAFRIPMDRGVWWATDQGGSCLAVIPILQRNYFLENVFLSSCLCPILGLLVQVNRPLTVGSTNLHEAGLLICQVRAC